MRRVKVAGIYGDQYEKWSSVLSTGWSFTKEVVFFFFYVSEFIAASKRLASSHVITEKVFIEEQGLDAT